MEVVMPDIGEVIRYIREEQGLSQRAVADACDMTHWTVRHVEATGMGTIKKIEAILDYLGYELEVVPKDGR